MDWTNVLIHLRPLSLLLLLVASRAQALEVYRSPSSPLSFARSAPQELEKTKNGVFEETWFFVETEHNESGWISQNEVIDIWAFAKAATAITATPLLSTPSLLSKPKTEVKVDQSVKIKGSHFNFLKVETKSAAGWVLRKDLKPQFDRFQYVVKKSYKDKSTWKLAGQIIEPKNISLQKITDHLTPFELDVTVLFENNSIMESPERHGRWIASADQKFWPLDQVKIIDSKNKVIFTQPHKKTCLRTEPSYQNTDCTVVFSTATRLKILNQEQIRWIKSSTTDLGVAYWKPSENESNTHHVTNEHESKITAINSKRIIFKGDQKSTDEGKTFHPYLRWDKIIALYIKQTREEPQSLEIKKVEITEGDVLRLHLRSRAGNQVELISKDNGNHWKIKPLAHSD